MPSRQRYEAQAKDLRVKIKSWEVDFYNAHGGKKPSRFDIKDSDMCMPSVLFFLLCTSHQFTEPFFQQPVITRNINAFATSSMARFNPRSPRTTKMLATCASANPPSNPLRSLPPPSASEPSRHHPHGANTPATASL